jgi:hypothetical protein
MNRHVFLVLLVVLRAFASVSQDKPDVLRGNSAAGPTGSPKFLLFWHVNHIAPKLAEDTCIIVYPSGLYHLEKSKRQGYDDKLKVRAFEDVLADTEVERLESLLNEPKLKSSTHHYTAEDKVFREREMTTVDIPREGHMQELIFTNYFGEPAWASPDIGSGIDREQGIISPLRKWLEAHAKTKKEVPLHNGVPTQCLPQ